MKIPNDYHFIFGLKPQQEAFHLVHFLCLESCLQVNRPCRVHFHYAHEPYGPWWERIRDRVTLHRIEPESFVSGHPGYARSHEGAFIRHAGLDYAHHADFLRLKILLELGGVYADMDTLFVNPPPDELFEQSFALGEEHPVVVPGSMTPQRSLCNAMLFSEAGAPFGREWLETMYRVFDGTWSRHSCQAATTLAERLPDQVYVAPWRWFYKHGCDTEGIETLFRGLDTDFSDVYSMHLWAHLWWSPQRVDFSTFHAGMLDEDYVRRVDTTYTVAARRFLA